MIDPFSDEADPVRLNGAAPPKLAREDEASDDKPAALDGLTLGRRPILLGLALLPTALSISGCVQSKPACPTKLTDPHHCQHRFCRYYRR